MTPDDVIVEAIAAASLHGDSAELRILMCLKLKEVIKNLPREESLNIKSVRE